ncbi:MAG: PIN domain-containing protein [Deltaproteobacteria bacterium]|nr:PIN domain-containing protein [Deltaproteobacteria bacterium]
MKRFIDTNVIAYAYDGRDRQKQQRALAVLRQCDIAGNGVVSTQVLQELFVVLTRKLCVEPVQARTAVHLISRFETVATTPTLVHAAIDTSILERLSLWDAMMVEAAAAAKCAELLTEDLQAGRRLRNVTVVNPFAGPLGGGFG